MEATEGEDAPAAESEPSPLQLRRPLLSRMLCRASAEMLRLSQCSITLATFLRASACSSSPSCALWQLHRGHSGTAQHIPLFKGCHTHCSCGRTCNTRRQCSGLSTRHTNRWPSRKLQQFPGVEATGSALSACWGSKCVNAVMGSPPGQVVRHHGRWRAPGPPSGAPGPPAQPPASHSGLIWLPLRYPLPCVGSGLHLMTCCAAPRRPSRAAGERSGTAAAPASPAQSRPLACSLSTVQPSIATLRCVPHMPA